MRDHFTCWGDQGKDQFPWQGQEVHDVVSAGRHLLLSLLAFLALLVVVIYREDNVSRDITADIRQKYWDYLTRIFLHLIYCCLLCINIYIWIEKFTTVKVISMYRNFMYYEVLNRQCWCSKKKDQKRYVEFYFYKEQQSSYGTERSHLLLKVKVITK